MKPKISQCEIPVSQTHCLPRVTSNYKSCLQQANYCGRGSCEPSKAGTCCERAHILANLATCPHEYAVPKVSTWCLWHVWMLPDGKFDSSKGPISTSSIFAGMLAQHPASQPPSAMCTSAIWLQLLLRRTFSGPLDESHGGWGWRGGGGGANKGNRDDRHL